MAPGFKVMLNGTEVVVVSTEGINVLNVRIHGDRISPEFANLDISGGLYGESDEDKHLIWIDDLAICAGDEIAVTLLEDAFSSCPGKTISELYKDDQEVHGPWQPMEQWFQELAQKPFLHERFTFTITTPSEAEIISSTLPEDYSFGFSITWTGLHPERANVSLSSNTLEGILHRTGGTDHAKLRLQCGQTVKLRIDVESHEQLT